VTISITATAKDAASRRVTFACRGINGRGETIMTGTARVIAPQVKMRMERPDAAQVSIQSHDNFGALRRTLSATAAGIGRGRASL
jgi:phosphate acetyltransferase